MSKGEAELAWYLEAIGIPFKREYQFKGVNGDRRWRFDFALLPIDMHLAVEVEGGLYVQGRHTRGKGYENDLVKYNEAAMMGWTVLRYSTGQVKKMAIPQIEKMFHVKQNELLSP